MSDDNNILSRAALGRYKHARLETLRGWGPFGTCTERFAKGYPPAQLGSLGIAEPCFRENETDSRIPDSKNFNFKTEGIKNQA
jgi:hypothetical protein